MTNKYSIVSSEEPHHAHDTVLQWEHQSSGCPNLMDWQGNFLPL